jgi:mannose-6-phosphate isomerase-like protein (cupin superfamily)
MRITRVADAKALKGDRSRSYQLIGPDVLGSRKFMITLVDVRPGGSTPLHEHRTVESMYFILEGRAEVQTAREKKILGANTAVYFPAGGSHGIRNVGRGRLRYLSCHAPPYEIEELYRHWQEERSRVVVTGG